MTMGVRFWQALLASFLVVSIGLAGAGWLAARLLASPPAKKFESSFLSFELPPGWTCSRSGTETVCETQKLHNDAIVILAVKYRGPQDTLANYEDHLKSPQSNARDKSLQSEVKFVNRRRISGQDWVEGLHFQSEVANYYTHYFATVTSHIGVLATFSVHKDFYEARLPEVTRMISSLVIYQGAANRR